MWYYEFYEVLQDNTSYYKWYYKILKVLRVVVQVTMRNYECYQEVLGGTTSCSTNQYVVLREVSGTMSNFLEEFSKRSSFKKNCYEQFHKNHGKLTLIESLHWWNYNHTPINLLKKDSTVGVFLWYWTTVNFDVLLIVMNETEHLIQRHIQNPIKHLRWGFIQK